MRLSAIDFSSTPDGAIHLAALCESQECYERFWIGEHHSTGQVPDPLTVAVLAAGVTERIRIGTGAVSLIYRNPYMLAETALIAERLFPNRIDLGVTKATTPTDSELAARLLDAVDTSRLDYEARVAFLRDALSRQASSPLKFLAHSVAIGPPIYLMATFGDRGRQAGELGLGMCTSVHHTGSRVKAAECISAYRQSFRPSKWFDEPNAIVVVGGYVGDEAGQVRTIRQTLDERIVANGVLDDPINSALRLREIGAEVGANEVMFLPLQDSASCYRLLAEGWKSSH